MKAIIIGATGATGKLLLEQLLADAAFTQVDIFVRRETGVAHAKLCSHVIDFDKPETWTHLVQGDVLFSCLGTTIKAAGSQAAQYKIDHDYQLAFAQAAKQNGVRTLVLVSAAGANAKSRAFYTRMKGELENAVTQLDFAQYFIFRPPILERANSDRAVEIWGVKIIKLLNKFGLFTEQKPMPAACLAKAMSQCVKSQSQSQVFNPKAIWQLLD